MKLIFFIPLFLFSSALLSQERIRISEESFFDKNFRSSSQNYVKEKSNNSIKSLNPFYKMRGMPFPSGEKNYIFNFRLSSAGDVNGDGKEDLFVVKETANENTPELEDKVVKTIIYFGSDSGISKENIAIVREDLRFIEDLTNDGISESYRLLDDKLSLVYDNSHGQLSSFTEIEIPSPEYPYIESQGDLNQDGFNDLLLYSLYLSEESTQTTYVIYGNEDLESLEIDTLSLEGVNKDYQRLFHTDVDGDNSMELIQVSGDNNDGSKIKVRIYELTEDGEAQKINEVDISTEIISNYLSILFGGIGLADLNNDGKEELLMLSISSNTLWAFTLSDVEGVYYSEDNVHQITTNVSDFSIIGDYNNDGHVDLFVTGEENKFITLDPNFTVSSTEIPLEDAESLISVFSRNKERRTAGDINGDNFNDLVIIGIKGDTLQYRTYLGNANSDLSSYIGLVFNTALVKEETAFATTNIGDINNDGKVDFSISYLKDNKIEFYFDGYESEPSVTILAKNEGRQSPPVSGDFNGDGISDVIIKYSSLSEALSSKFHIYFGSDIFDSEEDYTLNFKNLYPELSSGSIGNVSNVGDINHDGIDDIAVASSQENENTFILLGGENISNLPDIKIPLFASNAINGKDFNKDGINDFFIINTETNEFYLLNGFPNNELFSDIPLIKLTIPPRDFENNNIQRYLGQTATVGDFDGDLNMELAVSALSHYNLLDRAGSPAIYFFKGGTEMDSQADGSISLPIELYGGNGYDSSNQYYNSNVGVVVAVPDQNKDGKDELLFSSGLYQTFGFVGGLDGATNSVLYFGNELDEMSKNPSLILQPPNKRLGLGVQNTTLNVGQNIPAIGDFNGNGSLNFLFIQEKEWNFVNEPIYVYELSENLVSNEEFSSTINSYNLSQNYPNPFNPSTNISYSIPQTSNVSLKVYDVTGRLVSTLVNSRQASGNYNVSLNASSWASGIYFYRIVAGDYVKTRKFTLIK